MAALMKERIKGNEESKGKRDIPGAMNWLALKETLPKSKRMKKHRLKKPEIPENKDISKEVWFDDLDIDVVDGEIVAKQPKPAPSPALINESSLITGPDHSVKNCVGIDCEMVGGGAVGSEYSMLARCTLVNHHGNVVYDKYVKPLDHVINYRTQYSGICPSHLENAEDFTVVQKEVANIISDKTLVGHGLHNDLKVLFLSHPKKNIRDTANYKPFKKLSKGKSPSLQKIAKEVLGLDIHNGEHDPIEDARIAMRLYQMNKRDWEKGEKDIVKVVRHVAGKRNDRPSKWEVIRGAKKMKGKRLGMKEKRKVVWNELMDKKQLKNVKTKVDTHHQPFHILLNETSS
jgi:RNA exonuclease 4